MSFIPLANIAVLLLGPGDAEAVVLDDRFIRLSDLAFTGSEADVRLAQVPDGKSTLEIEAETANRLIRNRIPNARFQLKFVDRIVFRVPQDRRSAQACFEASKRILAGEVIYSDDVRAAECKDDRVTSIVTYDRDARAFKAISAITAGTALGPIRPSTVRRAARGHQALLITGSGTVTVSRSVTTLQPARAGKQVFVQTSDNQVFAVPFDRLEDEENK